MKKIMLLGAEAVPFASTGGLGDVMGSLPYALKKHYGRRGDVRVVLPLYSKVGEAFRKKMTFVKAFTVSLAWRRQYCGVFEYRVHGVTYYFLDNEYYFDRDTLYGQFDDGERYAFFCRAALDLMHELDFFPDVLHANDWQSALAVVYLRCKYGMDERYARIKTVFTIHNIEYQGIYDHGILGDVFDLPPEAKDTVDFDGCINLMKGAIVCCDKLTTVSPTYSKEIRYDYFGGRMADLIRQQEGKLCGIVNGIDTEYYNPAKDKEIPFQFTAAELTGKREDKLELQRQFGLPEDPAVPVIAMVSRLASHKGFDLVACVLEEILQWQVQFVLLGTGEDRFESYFKRLAAKYPSKAGVAITFNKGLAKLVYAGSDMFLMPSKSEPCGLSQMIAATYGSVPIVHAVGGLADTIIPFNPESGEGNGVNFHSYNAHDMMDTVRRAVTLYYTDEDAWARLQQNAMASDFTWNASAQGYADVYDSL